MALNQDFQKFTSLLSDFNKHLNLLKGHLDKPSFLILFSNYILSLSTFLFFLDTAYKETINVNLIL